MRGRGHASLGAARGASRVSRGAGQPGAGAPDLKSRMFGWGLSSPNKQSTTLFKTEGHTGEGPGHLISISPPQGSATSYLEGPQTGGVGGSGRDQGWAAAAIHPEVTWGPPPSCWTCGTRVLPTDTLLAPILTTGTQIPGLRARKGPREQSLVPQETEGQSVRQLPPVTQDRGHETGTQAPCAALSSTYERGGGWTAHPFSCGDLDQSSTMFLDSLVPWSLGSPSRCL